MANLLSTNVTGTINSTGNTTAAGFTGNANVGGTGSATWHPSGIYSGGTEWLYGTMYRNGSDTYHAGGSLYQVGLMELNNGFRISQGGSNYGLLNSWLKLGADYGLFSDTNGAHWLPNNQTSYGAWRMIGSRNSYDGIYSDYSRVNAFMYDSGGNGGAYRENDSLWYYYWNNGNRCLGINGSATSGSYSLYVSGGIYATGDIVAYSDERKKTNIAQISGALDKVLELRGVTYDKIGDEKSDSNIGFIAQEVEKVLPEAVTYAEDVDEYGVKYGNITALLVEAIKEQQKQIDELKKRLGE